MSVAAWLALGSMALIFALIIFSSAVTLALGAIRERSVVDGLYFVALVVLVGSLLWLVTQQTRALRKLKSAERAREMAVQLAKLDGAGSGMRLLAALRAVYSDKPLVLGKLNAAALALQPHHSDRDVIELLNREIFTAMDQQADQQIQKADCAPPSVSRPVRIRRSTPLWSAARRAHRRRLAGGRGRADQAAGGARRGRPIRLADERARRGSAGAGAANLALGAR